MSLAVSLPCPIPYNPPVHTPPRLALFISGRGSNARAILAAIRQGALTAEGVCLIASSAKAPGLTLGAEFGLPALPLNPARYPTAEDYARDLLRWLEHYDPDLLILAGYLKLLPAAVIARYPGRILNIHPALLPRHGGPGMYGSAVHQAVLGAGDPESGASVHLVTEQYDEGPVLAQVRVPVAPDDTPVSLAARILEQEHRLYPWVIGACLDALRRGEPVPVLGDVTALLAAQT